MSTTTRDNPGSIPIRHQQPGRGSVCRRGGERSDASAPGRPAAIALLACWGLASLAAPVAAATLSFGNFFLLPAASGGGNPTSTAVLSVPQFDPSLGTLEAIDFELIRGILNFTWTIDNESPSGVAFLNNVGPAAFTRLAWFGGALAEFPQKVTFDPPFPFISGDTDGVPDFMGTDALTLSGSFPLLHAMGSLTDPMLLGAFTGTSSMFLEERVRFLPSAPFPGPFFHDASIAQSTGGVIWRYQFTPAQDPPLGVPEPASLVLALTGVMGLVAQIAGQRRMRGRCGRTVRRTPRQTVAAPARRSTLIQT